LIVNEGKELRGWKYLIRWEASAFAVY